VSNFQDADAEMIGQTLLALAEGFRTRDAEAMRGLYVNDADWTNAYGTTLSGRDAIVDHLRRLFADATYKVGETVGRPRMQLRLVGSDVVVAKTYAEVKDEGKPEGSARLRRTHSLKVLAKQPDGTWKIESEMFMDACEETDRRHG